MSTAMTDKAFAGSIPQTYQTHLVPLVYLFSVWDQLATSEFADIVTSALENLFPADPPRCLARIPYNYADEALIRRDLVTGGIGGATIETISARSTAASPQVAALAYCQGMPVRSEIEARGPTRLSDATDATAEAIAQRFGRGAVDGQIQAKVVTWNARP